MNEYSIILSDGTAYTTVYPLEVNGPDNVSTPRQIMEARPQFQIVGVNPGLYQLTLAGVEADHFLPGNLLEIVGSTGNDSTQTIDSAVPSGPNTIVTLAGTPALDPTPDGVVLVHTFKLSGDMTYRFIPGFVFDVINSAEIDGSYTVAASGSTFNPTDNVTIIPVAHGSIRDNGYPPSIAVPYGAAQYSITDANTTISLAGKGTVNYGEDITLNLVRMLENFASDLSPDTNPNIGSTIAGNQLTGQLWYDTANSELKVYDGGWVSTGGGGDGWRIIDDDGDTFVNTEISAASDEDQIVLQLGDNADGYDQGVVATFGRLATSISALSATSASGLDGGNVDIKAGTGDDTTGGKVTLSGGRSGSTSGQAGNVEIFGGNTLNEIAVEAIPAVGEGGDVVMSGGWGETGFDAGGILLGAGAVGIPGPGAATPPTLQLDGVTSALQGGGITLEAGLSATSVSLQSGSITIRTGLGLSDVVPGDIDIECAGTNRAATDGGDIRIQAGQANAGAGGMLSLFSGVASSGTSTVGGLLTIESGSGYVASGDVIIGSGNSNGLSGTVSILTGSSSEYIPANTYGIQIEPGDANYTGSSERFGAGVQVKGGACADTGNYGVGGYAVLRGGDGNLGGDARVIGGASSTAVGNGGKSVIVGGTGYYGGAVNITGGFTTYANGYGGGVTIEGGTAQNYGGEVLISGGVSISADAAVTAFRLYMGGSENTDGGDGGISAGNSSTGAGGDIFVLAGDSESGGGGAFSAAGGNITDGVADAGQALMRGGNTSGGTATGDGGAAYVFGGNALSTAGGYGGKVQLTGGESYAANGGAIEIAAGEGYYGGAVTITGGATTHDTDGTGTVTIIGGSTPDGYVGTDVTVQGGPAGGTSTAGDLNLYAGDNVDVGGYGGYIHIRTGQGDNTNGSSPVSILGYGSSSTDSGYLEIRGGDSTGTAYGGSVGLYGGDSVASEGGGVVVAAGSSNSIDGQGARVEIQSGGGYHSGNIELEIPPAQPGGTQGDVRILTSGGTTGTPLRFVAGIGLDTIGLVAPTSLTTSIDYTLPVAPEAGDRLETDASGVTSWEKGQNFDEVTVAGSPAVLINLTNVTAKANDGTRSYVQVFKDGVLQREGTHFTVTSTSLITWATPLTTEIISVYQI